ncbi:MAG: hypothetical protein QM478_05405 [Flavobacteriaceae bacterium]
MKNIITLFALLFAGISFAQTAQNETAMKYAETITIEDMKEDLTILASDALEGRETGKRGQKMAAAYIRAHFEELGLVGPVKEGQIHIIKMFYLNHLNLEISMLKLVILNLRI